MRQKFSQRLEMQISQGNDYIGVSSIKNFEDNFNKLSQNYEIENSDKLKEFIKKHENVLEYIRELTPLINKYFPNNEKSIEFCEDPEFDDLDFVMIYIECSIYEKDKKTLDEFKKEPLYISKFSRNIRGLLCVELW